MFDNFKKIGILVSGNILATVIMFLGIIYLSRLYSPSDFGTYGIVFALVLISSSFSSFRYEMTILLPKDRNKAFLALTTSICISLANHLIFFLAINFLIFFKTLDSFWIFAPATSFFYSFINICSFLQNRNKHYSKLALIQVLRVLVFIFSAIFLSKSTSTGNGLLAAMLISNLLPAVLLIFIELIPSNFFSSYVSKKDMLYWAKKNKKFFIFSTPAVFIGSLATSSPIFLLSIFFTESAVGFYTMVQRIIMKPVEIISSAINKIYLQAISNKIAHKEKIYTYTLKILFYVFSISLLISLISYYLFSLNLLEYILGDQWAGIDILAIILIPVLFFGFISKAVAGFAILNKNEYGLYYQIYLLLQTCLFFLIVVSHVSEIVYVFASISAGFSLAYFLQTIAILWFSRDIDKD